MQQLKYIPSAKIDLCHIWPGLSLTIDEKRVNTLFDCENAEQEGEARYQLKEGCFYDYEFSDNNYSFKPTDYIQPHKKQYIGVIAPNVYVGTLALEVLHKDDPENLYKIHLEVQSVKLEDYRKDYRYMLESITEKCTDLIMQIDSPISQNFETNFETDSKTQYQRFSFVKALIDSKEFEEAIQKIVSNPSTKWYEEHEEKDIRNIRRFTQKNIKQLASKSNRTEIRNSHFLHTLYGLRSIPTKIESSQKRESTDTAENKFIKHALEDFLFFCENCETKFEKYSSAKLESNILSSKISNLLNQSFFKEISRPDSLKLNSPVLQRKSGYREVLNAWLKFDLAAKLIWRGGDNVYKAGKKDIATLYEYWLFFTLLDILKNIFKIDPRSIEQLIQFDKGKLSLTLNQGTAIALKGVYKSASRNLHIQFSYNRSFGGGKKYPLGGSYTTTLRPDYTLSIWPEEIKDSKEAEKQELITHIHFDAKYKVDNFYKLISTPTAEELTNEEENELTKDEIEETKSGNFKNQDLLKMHAYKDAIRRTGGAYVLYPGEGEDKPFRGFHELIPGLGAFVIKPNGTDRDKEYLQSFIKKVVNNFLDRSSQRENSAVKTYDIHKQLKLDSETLNEPMPEYVNGAKLIPTETFVLVGYYKTKEQLDWILDTGLYNFRTGTDKGSLPLGLKEVSAKYILLHGPSETETNKIYNLKAIGPKIFSKQNLLDEKYPTIPSGDLYLIYQIENDVSENFNNAKFNLKNLKNFVNFRSSPKPITVSLEELMKVKVPYQ